MLGKNLKLELFNNIEKTIIEFKKQQMSDTDITKELKVTRQYVSLVFQNIIKKVLEHEKAIEKISNKCFIDIDKIVLDEWKYIIADIISKTKQEYRLRYDKNNNIVLIHSDFVGYDKKRKVNHKLLKAINEKPLELSELSEKLNVDEKELSNLLRKYSDDIHYKIGSLIIYYGTGKIFQAINQYALVVDEKIEVLYENFKSEYAKKLQATMKE